MSVRNDAAVAPMAKERTEAGALVRPALSAAPKAAADAQANRAGRSEKAVTVPAQRGLLDAVAAGQIDAVRSLLDATSPDFDRDVDGRTALTLAVLRSDAAMVVLLLEHGADRLAQDRFGQTPIGYAATAGDPPIKKAFGLK